MIKVFLCKKKLNFLLMACCLSVLSGNAQAQQISETEQGDADIQINDMSSISTDPRPFKRRALPKKAAPVEITSAEQMRQMLGSPHEMTDEPSAPLMPAGFSVSNPQENETAAPQRPVRPTCPQRPKRGGAGGISRPAPEPVTSSLARQKIQAARDKRTAEKKANPTAKEKFVQEGLKMFDEQTAKQVMNIQPNAQELENLSPEARQRLLDSIEVNKKTPAPPAAEEQAGKYGGGKFRNIKDNPY